MRAFSKICLACILLLCAGAPACGNAPQLLPDTGFVARIDGCEVPLEEYRLFARDAVATVAGHFAGEHGADPNDESFWETEYGGATPLAELKTRADEQMARQKGIQLLAHRFSILEDPAYAAFEAELEGENAARRQQAEDGGVVYGPKQYEQLQYYSYRQSQLEAALLEHVEQALVQPTGEELLGYYDEIKDSESRKNFTADTVYFAWPATGADAEVAALLRAAAEEGLDPAGCAKKAGEAAGLGIEWYERTIDTYEMGKEDAAYVQAVQLVREVEAGGWSEPLAGGDGAGVAWVRAKQWEAFGPYEENAAYVEMLYREERARQYIDSEIGKLKTEYTAAHEALTIGQLYPGLE